MEERDDQCAGEASHCPSRTWKSLCWQSGYAHERRMNWELGQLDDETEAVNCRAEAEHRGADIGGDVGEDGALECTQEWAESGSGEVGGN